jgi:hypothetical protein
MGPSLPSRLAQDGAGQCEGCFKGLDQAQLCPLIPGWRLSSAFKLYQGLAPIPAAFFAAVVGGAARCRPLSIPPWSPSLGLGQVDPVLAGALGHHHQPCPEWIPCFAPQAGSRGVDRS